MCSIFEKVMLRGPQKACNVPEHVTYKYTNTITQIHKNTNTRTNTKNTNTRANTQTQINKYNIGQNCRYA